VLRESGRIGPEKVESHRRGTAVSLVVAPSRRLAAADAYLACG
jgi:hypothetical protein